MSIHFITFGKYCQAKRKTKLNHLDSYHPEEPPGHFACFFHFLTMSVWLGEAWVCVKKSKLILFSNLFFHCFPQTCSTLQTILWHWSYHVWIGTVLFHPLKSICFFFLAYCTKTSSIMLNENIENRYPSPLSDPRGNSSWGQSFTIKYDTSLRCFLFYRCPLLC